jgi:hypothetical protein
MSMTDEVFYAILNRYRDNPGNQKVWPYLANGYGFISGEAARSAFKREMQKRGVRYKSDEGVVPATLPKIIVMDIEMLPSLGYFFDRKTEYIRQEQVFLEGTLLSWAAKALNSHIVYSAVMTPKEVVARSPKRLVKLAWEMLHDVQIVIGHNFRSFDGKILNTLFLKYGLSPLRYAVVDTLEVAKANFRFPSNSLDNINEYLGLRKKVSHDGFKLWRKCAEGDIAALEKMAEYNRGDVLANEDLYYRFRPYIRNHPNLGWFTESEEEVCRNCASEDLRTEGRYPGSGIYESVRCMSCGALSRRRTNLVSKGKRKSILGV